MVKQPETPAEGVLDGPQAEVMQKENAFTMEEKMVKKAETRAVGVLDAPEGEAEETAFTQFVDHQKKAVTEVGKALTSLLPQGLREHGETAIKEMMEGYRTLFNSTVDEVVKTVEKAKFEKK
jgi:hypothetical protein